MSILSFHTAGFSIATYLTMTMQNKRKTFVGSPYWMAPEVANLDKKGYSKQCDIWALGITAIELAEKQPPMFDLHPMRLVSLIKVTAGPWDVCTISKLT